MKYKKTKPISSYASDPVGGISVIRSKLLLPMSGAMCKREYNTYRLVYCNPKQYSAYWGFRYPESYMKAGKNYNMKSRSIYQRAKFKCKSVKMTYAIAQHEKHSIKRKAKEIK